jgi:hypothetical protein
MVRSRADLLAENALLRQQLIVLRRQVPHARFRAEERVMLVLLARLARGWRSALLIVQPATIPAMAPRAVAAVLGEQDSRGGPPGNDPARDVRPVESIAAHNRLWGAERIRGELLKLGVHCSKRKI